MDRKTKLTAALRRGVIPFLWEIEDQKLLSHQVVTSDTKVNPQNLSFYFLCNKYTIVHWRKLWTAFCWKEKRERSHLAYYWLKDAQLDSSLQRLCWSNLPTMSCPLSSLCVSPSLSPKDFWCFQTDPRHCSQIQLQIIHSWTSNPFPQVPVLEFL